MRNVWIILTLGLTVFLSGETVSFYPFMRLLCEKRTSNRVKAAGENLGARKEQSLLLFKHFVSKNTLLVCSVPCVRV